MNPVDQSSLLLEQAEAAASDVIARNFTSRGLSASADGYLQVWARDTMITMLGASLNSTPLVLDCLRVSLETLGDYQDRFGQIPYLVHCADGRAEFGSSDANVWWVIGAATLMEQSWDEEWLARHADKIIKALDWCESMDFRKNGLMISTEMVDWADLLPNRDNVLFPNVLCAYALRKGAQLLESCRPQDSARFAQRAAVVAAAIRDYYWVKEVGTFTDNSHFKVRTMISIGLRKRPYFLPWVSQCDWGEHFDTTANLLAIMAGIADEAQSAGILDYISETGINRPYPVQVMYPPTQIADKEWRDYMKIYNLNLPHQYHNGGIWPWVGGLYVAALVKVGRIAAAREELLLLAEALRQGKEEWECNEWLHGTTGVPMGFKDQAWSAGMFLYALQAVNTGQMPELIAMHTDCR